MSSILKSTLAALASAAFIAVAAHPTLAYGRYDTKTHPASQGWRWSERNHTWYRAQSNAGNGFVRPHANRGEPDDWRYSHRNHTWYYSTDRDDTADHPASQGWRWSNHDHMWYQVGRHRR